MGSRARVVTRIIEALDQKQSSAELLPLVYDELRCLAARMLAQERPGQTLQATALVHEAWLRLAGDDRAAWDSRGHFFVAAAEAMRRILVENARRKKRLKHGGGWERIQLDQVNPAGPMRSDDMLALDEAMSELERLSPVCAQVVKLRFFAGLTHSQIAKILGVSLSTVERSWSFSRAWLFQRVREGEIEGDKRS